MSVPGVSNSTENRFTGRQRRRLSTARENGYLNAVCRDGQKLLAAYSQWCWRMRIPVVWSERCSPRSRYGRVRLDLFTTPNRLTADCQADLQSLAGRVTTSPHDARWERIQWASCTALPPPSSARLLAPAITRSIGARRKRLRIVCQPPGFSASICPAPPRVKAGGSVPCRAARSCARFRTVALKRQLACSCRM